MVGKYHGKPIRRSCDSGPDEAHLTGRVSRVSAIALGTLGEASGNPTWQVEIHGKSTQNWCFTRKFTELNRAFSIAMFDYQRVNPLEYGLFYDCLLVDQGWSAARRELLSTWFPTKAINGDSHHLLVLVYGDLLSE